MIKIGLITLYNSDNFGAMLQAYALKKKISNFGYECEIIQHNRFGYEISKEYSGKRLQISQLIAIAKICFKCPSLINYYFSLILKRDKKREQKSGCKQFRDMYFTQLDATFYQTEQQIINDPPICDGFVCGSDQIWNPERIEGAGAFFLNFVPEGIPRIAYAPSIAKESIPQEYRQKYRNWVSKFDAVSVREITGCHALKEATGIDAVCTLDPTLLLKRQEWLGIATDIDNAEKYIFCYFLSARNAALASSIINKCAKDNKMQVLVLPAEISKLHSKWKTKYCAGPQDFLAFIANASLVFTDSFHGTALSIKMERNFYTYNGVAVPAFAKRFSRMGNLLDTVGLSERVFNENSTLLYDPVDYLKVSEKLEPHIQFSQQYLASALGKVVPQNRISSNSPNFLAAKETCTGCGACAAVCAKSAIKMQQNDGGFWHPKIDYKKCVKCGLCVKHCPIRNPIKSPPNKTSYNAVWAKDIQVRKNGSSGNAFGLLALQVLKNGGVVFGSALSDSCKELKCTNTQNVPLNKLQKSKYFESAMDDAYSQIENVLQKGNAVLFCGTPCQVMGLRSVFGKCKNLILCDFICHGVPSAKLFRSYLDAMENKYGSSVVDVQFRSKAYGWKLYCMQIKFQNKKIYLKTRYSDPWYIDFFANKHLRTNCYSCNRIMYSAADITLGDYWAVKDKKNIIDTDEGISIVAVHTDTGYQAFDMMNVDESAICIKLNDSDIDQTFVTRTRTIPKNNEEVPHSFSLKPKLSKRQHLQKLYYAFKIRLLRAKK